MYRQHQMKLIGKVRRLVEYVRKVSVAHIRRLRALEYVASKQLGERAQARKLGVQFRGSPKMKRLATVYVKPLGTNVVLQENSTDVLVLGEVIFDGAYECVDAYLDGVDYILDIGSNIGIASKYFSAKFKTAKILMVEPDFGNFSISMLNLRDEILIDDVWH